MLFQPMRPFILSVLLSLLAVLPLAHAEQGIVQKIVDGDTLHVKVGPSVMRVRMLCIDALESAMNQKTIKDQETLQQDPQFMIAGGKQAKRHLESMVKKGDNVELRYGSTRYDRGGRLLAFVYLQDGTDVNLMMVKDGFAGILCGPDSGREVEFSKALADARSQQIGLWGHGYRLPERSIGGKKARKAKATKKDRE